MKLEVFDPPMCCSSGVCGPKVDKKLVEFGASLAWLREQGVETRRYNPTHDPVAFVANAKVVDILNGQGTDALPLIVVDGKVVRQGSYPDRDELAVLAGLASGKAVPA